MCILCVKMAAEAVSKLPQDFTGGKDLRTEALGDGPVGSQSKKTAQGDRNLMAKPPWHFIVFTKSTSDSFTETHSPKDDSTHGAKRVSLEKALQVER